MADILKVTTPSAGYDTTAKTNPITTNDTNIQNIIDPSKVTRPDGKAGGATSDNQDNKFSLTYESNFDKFVQMLKSSQGLTQTLSELLFTRMGVVVSSGISENFAQEISQFMEMMKMSEDELLNFLKNQSDSSVRFKGAFFNVLRQVFEGTNSIDLKTNILDFLRKYNDMASSGHIMNNIMQNLKSILQSIPKSYRPPLEELINQLSLQQQTNADGKTVFTGGGDFQKNSTLLKNQILPYLSSYISKTHDLGRPRDIITLLTLNIARYENTGKDNFMQAFESLLRYQAVRDKLGNIDPKQIEAILNQTQFEKAGMKDSLMDKLASIIEKGITGEGTYETKAVFQNIMTSLLVNESVYMPLLHMMIPADIDGRLLFSEIWIDPDDESGRESSDEKERCVKLFIKFDIKDVGFFDLILASQNGTVDMQLYYPEKLASIEKEMKSGIQSIIERNGLSFRNFFMEKSMKPKLLSEVFPKIYERKNAINVRI